MTDIENCRQKLEALSNTLDGVSTEELEGFRALLDGHDEYIEVATAIDDVEAYIKQTEAEMPEPVNEEVYDEFVHKVIYYAREKIFEGLGEDYKFLFSAILQSHGFIECIVGD